MNAKISTYLIGIVIFVLFIMGGVTMIGILNTTKTDFIDTTKYSSFNGTVNKFQEVDGKLTTLQGSIENAGGGSDISALIQVAWNTIKTLPSLLSFMATAYFGLGEVFGIPTWMITLLSGIATIIIVFTIWGAIFQNDV